MRNLPLATQKGWRIVNDTVFIGDISTGACQSVGCKSQAKWRQGRMDYCLGHTMQTCALCDGQQSHHRGEEFGEKWICGTCWDELRGIFNESAADAHEEHLASQGDR